MIVSRKFIDKIITITFIICFLFFKHNDTLTVDMMLYNSVNLLKSNPMEIIAVRTNIKRDVIAVLILF